MKDEQNIIHYIRFKCQTYFSWPIVLSISSNLSLLHIVTYFNETMTTLSTLIVAVVLNLSTNLFYLSKLMAASVHDEQLVTKVMAGHSMLHMAAPKGQWGSVTFRTTSNGMQSNATVRSDTAKLTRR